MWNKPKEVTGLSSSSVCNQNDLKIDVNSKLNLFE